jgi:hypothetical protein
MLLRKHANPLLQLLLAKASAKLLVVTVLPPLLAAVLLLQHCTQPAADQLQ